MPVLREWWTRVRVFNIFIEKIRSQSRIVTEIFGEIQILYEIFAVCEWWTGGEETINSNSTVLKSSAFRKFHIKNFVIIGICLKF